METEEEFGYLFNKVMDEIELIHQRTMNVKNSMSLGYKEEYTIQRHRHMMGGDEGIHLTIKNTEEDGN